MQNSGAYSSEPTAPTTSNYLAPWPVYAFDWCKWPIQNQQIGDSAGKMALGSYVEDGHNFVSGVPLYKTIMLIATRRSKYLKHK